MAKDCPCQGNYLPSKGTNQKENERKSKRTKKSLKGTNEKAEAYRKD